MIGIAEIEERKNVTHSLGAKGDTMDEVITKLINQVTQHYAQPQYDFTAPEATNLKFQHANDWDADDVDWVDGTATELKRLNNEVQLEMRQEIRNYNNDDGPMAGSPL